MMAHESTPPSPPRLDPQTMDELRAVLDRAARRGNHTDELHVVLQRAAAEAHEKSIQAEHLLLIMKDLWQSLPEVRRVSDSGRQTTLLQELISRCIEQYYHA
jgi:hypothetical protein